MADAIPVGKVIPVRECGHDKFWLQDIIFENPSVLGLGDLEPVDRERRHSGGGRLDILLREPEEDSMHEVEVMLGECDETHIIRTIEYWNRERRRFPKRQHIPVLVAEGITRRFFDVIEVLSHAIPLIAIQATILEAGGHRLLTFNKILDAYEEPEYDDAADFEPHDEAYWIQKAPWTNDIAKTFLNTIRSLLPVAELNYAKSYIAIAVNGNNYFTFHVRAAGRALLVCYVGELRMSKARELLDRKGTQYAVRKNESLRITTDESLVRSNADGFRDLAKMVQEAWAG